jgi:hypothetical protein
MSKENHQFASLKTFKLTPGGDQGITAHFNLKHTCS